MDVSLSHRHFSPSLSPSLPLSLREDNNFLKKGTQRSKSLLFGWSTQGPPEGEAQCQPDCQNQNAADSSGGDFIYTPQYGEHPFLRGDRGKGGSGVLSYHINKAVVRNSGGGLFTVSHIGRSGGSLP